MRLYRIIFLVLITAVPSVSHAQARAATTADSTLVRDNIYRRLFDGIELSADLQRQARLEIAECHTAQQSILPITSDLKWRQLVALQDQRDSTLQALLTDAGDRKRFARNAEAMRPRSRVWKEK